MKAEESASKVFNYTLGIFSNINPLKGDAA